MLQQWPIEETDVQSPQDGFSDAVNDLILSCECRIDDSTLEDDFDVSLDAVEVGGVGLYKYRSCGTHSAHRDAEHVKHDSSDDLLMYVPLTSGYHIDQNGNEIDLAQSTATFVALDQPFTATFVADPRVPMTGANIRVPRALLRDRLPRIDDCIYERIPLDRGAGRLMLSLFESVFDEARYLDESVSAHIGGAMLDAISSVGQSWLGTDTLRERPRLSGSRKLTRQRINDFVLANLGRQKLCPSLIAENCNVSLRSVHMAFEDSNWTITSWIKEQRLLRCRRELQDPSLLHRSITQIAYSWGFSDVAHFSRAYKARFSLSPSADRAASLRQA
ncbi:MAG: helix-turn-helix domain-containing protein [Pseudomonadota bacterium]